MTKDVMKQKVDINKVVNAVHSAYGKNKGLASQISTGSGITRPTKPSEFVVWKDSPWQELTGIMGLPLGKVVQIAGKSNAGKSTHAMQFMKLAQDQGFIVVVWDSEGKFSASRFDNYFKGDSSQLIVCTARFILEGADECEKIIHAIKEQDQDAKILLVWDSVGGSLAKNEEENSLLEGKQMAAAPKDNGAAIRAFVRLMDKYKNREKNEETISVLLINQLYSNIGSVGSTQSGGVKIEYFSSLIVQLTRKKDLTVVKKGVKMKTGIVTRAKVSKNHLFDGEMNVAELDLVITAGGIDLFSKQKVKEESGFEDDGEVELESDE